MRCQVLTVRGLRSSGFVRFGYQMGLGWVGGCECRGFCIGLLEHREVRVTAGVLLVWRVFGGATEVLSIWTLPAPLAVPPLNLPPKKNPLFL
jgi:hypothetical protein